MRTIEEVSIKPQAGDVVVKTKGTRTLVRIVYSVAGGNIRYRDLNGKEKVCWISTWMEWCRGAAIDPSRMST